MQPDSEPALPAGDAPSSPLPGLPGANAKPATPRINLEGFAQHRIRQLLADFNALGIEAAISVQYRLGNATKNTTAILSDGPEQARTLLTAMAKDVDAESKKITSLAMPATPGLVLPAKG